MSENHYYAFAYTDFDGLVKVTDHILRIPAFEDCGWVERAVDGLHEEVHLGSSGRVQAPGVVVPALVVERDA